MERSSRSTVQLCAFKASLWAHWHVPRWKVASALRQLMNNFSSSATSPGHRFSFQRSLWRWSMRGNICVVVEDCSLIIRHSAVCVHAHLLCISGAVEGFSSGRWGRPATVAAFAYDALHLTCSNKWVDDERRWRRAHISVHLHASGVGLRAVSYCSRQQALRHQKPSSQWKRSPSHRPPCVPNVALRFDYLQSVHGELCTLNSNLSLNAKL